MEILALIPARGGSKSIPRKNVRVVAGKPLIAYSIDQALSSKLITRTIVSTDDPEIADVAGSFGAEIPFMRPAEFAQDLSPDIDVFRHALQWLLDNEGYSPEMVVHLCPTGPVRRVELIDEAIEQMILRPDADSLRSVSWPTQTPYKMWRLVDGLLEPLLRVEELPESYCMPRQILPEVFRQNGYVDIVRSKVVLERGMMCGDRIIPFIVDEPVVELDYEEDLPGIEETLVRFQSGKDISTSRTSKRHPA